MNIRKLITMMHAQDLLGTYINSNLKTDSAEKLAVGCILDLQPRDNQSLGTNQTMMLAHAGWCPQ